MKEVRGVDGLVIIRIYRARSAKEGHSTAVLVEQGGLAYRGFSAVEGHDVATGRYPKRQIGIRKVLEIGEPEHRLVRYLYGAAMPGIVHDERSGGLLALDGARYFGITIACRSALTGIGIPHYLLDAIAGITG